MVHFKENAIYDWSDNSVRLVVTPSRNAKSAFFYVQETGHFQTNSSYFTERENLNSYLIVYTVSGKGYLKYKETSYTLLPGQVFFIDCMNHHHYETDKDELWEILWVHFNGSTSRGYYEQFARQDSPVTTTEQGSLIPSIIQNIVNSYQQKDVRTEPVGSKLLVNLLTELLLLTSDQDTSESFLPKSIQLIMQHLDKHFNEKITLDQLAKDYAISKYHLAKEFKKYTGFTINEYVINTRMNVAKELLKYSDLPVVDIATKVGIDNVSHFINLFKTREDMTPLVFRKKWQRPK